VTAALVTAGTLRERVLEPALDARSLNLEQKRLLLDPSPECDSAVEHVRALAQLVADERARIHIFQLGRLAHRLAASNGAEGSYERLVAGAADRLVRDLRALELRGEGDRSVAKEQLARDIRKPLRAIAAAAAPGNGLLPLVAAVRELDQVLDRAPADQLLSRTVEYQLGRATFGLLRELVGQRLDEQRAATA
jgi:hypothetical protein